MEAVRRNYLRIIFWTLTGIIACAIFLFSHQSGAESSEISGGITEYLSQILKINDPEMLGRIVRKGAHFTEYLCLGASLFSAISCTWDFIFKAVVAHLGATVYALSDEVHQYFVPERVCALTDVMIDASGALVGVIIAWLIFYIIKKRRSAA